MDGAISIESSGTSAATATKMERSTDLKPSVANTGAKRTCVYDTLEIKWGVGGYTDFIVIACCI